MGLLNDTKVKALLVGFLLSLVALVGIGTFGVLAVLSALAGASSGALLLFVVLDAAAPYAVGAMVTGALSFLLLVGLAVATVRRASMPRNEKLAGLARRVERHSPEARKVGLSERVEPTTEDRIADLKDRYVEGEIGEREYERRLEELVDDRNASDGRVRGERRRTEREFEREFEQ